MLSDDDSEGVDPGGVGSSGTEGLGFLPLPWFLGSGQGKGA